MDSLLDGITVADTSSGRSEVNSSNPAEPQVLPVPNQPDHWLQSEVFSSSASEKGEHDTRSKAGLAQ